MAGGVHCTDLKINFKLDQWSTAAALKSKCGGHSYTAAVVTVTPPALVYRLRLTDAMLTAVHNRPVAEGVSLWGQLVNYGHCGRN